MLSFLRDFWTFLRVRKKYWLLPVFIVMALFGGLIVLSKGSAEPHTPTGPKTREPTNRFVGIMVE